MAKSKAVGIDLGTTYSAMAWVDEHGAGKLIPNSEGDLLTPSVVLFEDDATIVGKEAKKVAVVKADRVAICVKRDMGKPVYSKSIRGQYLPPEVIQSYILSKLRHDVTRSIGPDFQAIITVPAFFDEPRRKATYDAGEMAGLKVLDIVNEPTAAALAFGQDLGYLTKYGAPKQRMNVIVYDLGGGTFDVTLIDMQAGDLKTLCTDGDVQLGGHDWDMRIVDFMSEAFMAEHKLDPREDAVSLQRMLSDAEEAKHTLSARQQVKLKVVHQGKTTNVDLTRTVFEQRTADLLERTRFTTRNLLRTAGLAWKDIGRILLTGGSTRMPSVIRMLKELTGLDPDHTVNPDEAVARGAAIYANYLLAAKGETGHAPTFDVTNVNAHSLGIEGTEPGTMRKINTILIPRNSPLPVKRAEQCITQFENQRTVVIQVLEGESRNPSECTPIGRTVINDLPPGLPQGWPVYVEYEYGINGRLNVTARVEGTDRIVRLELEREASMSKDRVKQWGRSVTKGAGLDDFDDAVQAEIASLTQQQHTLNAQAGQPRVALGGGPAPGASGIGIGSGMSGIHSGASGVHGGSSILSGGSGLGSKIVPTFPTVPTAAGAPGASGISSGASSIHGPDAGSSLSGSKRVPTHGGSKAAAGPPLVAGMPPPPGASGIIGAGAATATASSIAGKTIPTVTTSSPTVPTVPTVPTAAPTAAGVPAATQPAAAARPQSAPAAAPRDAGSDLILYVVFITLGIIVGYYVLVWAAPSANFLRLNLPGLPPASSSDVSPATPAGTPETTQRRPHPAADAPARQIASDARAARSVRLFTSAPRA